MTTSTALLIIDMQRELVQGGYEAQAVLANIGTLIERARAGHAPIVYMQHESERYAPLSYGAPGWEIDPAIAPAPGDIVLRKRASDSFYETPLMQTLRERGITRLVVTGMQTEYCVDTTCRVATSLGYDVTLAADGHTTGDTELLTAPQIIAYHNATLAELAQPDHMIAVQPAAAISFD